MTVSWKATGLLEQVWGKVGGRDKLAALTGIDAGNLSGYNTGRRPLGSKNAARIAAALNITLADLGAPDAAPEDHGRPVGVRLQELEDEMGVRRKETRSLERLVRELTARVARLEAQASEGRRTG